MASVVVGLSGRKQSGKDTFAARLVAEHGFTRFAFADPLRQATLGLDPLIVVERDEYHLFPDRWVLPVDRDFFRRLSFIVAELGWEEAKKIREVRRTLQRMGTEAIRQLDEDFWVRTTMRAVAEHEGPVVITDARFPNEHAAVMTENGYMVRIERPGYSDLPFSGDLHPSETALDHHHFDLTVYNNADLEHLHAQADGFAAGLIYGTPESDSPLAEAVMARVIPTADLGSDDVFTVTKALHRQQLQEWHNRPGA